MREPKNSINSEPESKLCYLQLPTRTFKAAIATGEINDEDLFIK
jgi:hypothetical protein